MEKQLKGIALILFGILLCVSDYALNHTVFRNFSDFPFSFLGILIGVAGIVFVFKNNRE